jgi:hypothetical protein
MGLAIAGALAAEGCAVTMLARTPEKLEQAAAGIPGAIAVPGDVRDQGALEQAVGRTVEERGRLDIIVNNAGGPAPGTFESTPAEAWADAFELSLNSAVRLTRLALPHLKQSGRGRVVNITSWSVREPIPNLMLSNAIRPGVVGWGQDAGTGGRSGGHHGEHDRPRQDRHAAGARAMEPPTPTPRPPPSATSRRSRWAGWPPQRRWARWSPISAHSTRDTSPERCCRSTAARCGESGSNLGYLQLGSMATCYRHPDRETSVSCSNCGRSICPDCMRQTPVGVRCPECAGQRTRSQLPAFMMANEPRVTYGLIAANVVLFIATNNINGGGGGGGLFGTGGQLNSLGLHLALWGPAVHDGQYYRLVSSAFIHYGLLHLAFNMYALYLLGSSLERYVGSPPLRPDLPALGAVRQLRRPAAVTELTDGRCLRGDLRADGGDAGA